MYQPEKNDLFYHLMQDGMLHLEDPGFEEDVLRQLQHMPHQIPANRTIRMSKLFLSIAIFLGLVLCTLYAIRYSPTVPADRSVSLLLQTILILTFLFLLEKIIRLLVRPGETFRS